MKNEINKISFSYSTSRGRYTFGYNIVRLDDRNTGKRYRTIGGGYDMRGTVIGQWLEDVYQRELLKLQGQAYMINSEKFGLIKNPGATRFYGMTHDEKADRVRLDGACGLDQMIRIGEAIGLEFERDYIAHGRRRGETIGYFVSMKKRGMIL